MKGPGCGGSGGYRDLCILEYFLQADNVSLLYDSLELVVYIYMPHPRSFEVAGVQGSRIHIKEHLQTTKVLCDQILSP